MLNASFEQIERNLMSAFFKQPNSLRNSIETILSKIVWRNERVEELQNPLRDLIMGNATTLRQLQEFESQLMCSVHKIIVWRLYQIE